MTKVLHIAKLVIKWGSIILALIKGLELFISEIEKINDLKEKNDSIQS